MITLSAAAEARRESKGIQAIETGYRVLVAIQQGPQPVPLKDIAKRARISPSQAHNYLSSYVRTGMVVAGGRGAYGLGPSLAALGMTAMTSLDRYEVIREEALRLREHTSLGVAVAIWTEMGPVIVFNKAGDPWGIFDLRNGVASILHTGSGNVFITYLDPEITDPPALRELADEDITGTAAAQHLESIRTAVRRDGFAMQTLSEMPGYDAISAPVWDAHGEVLYALTITGPRDRIDSGPREWLTEQLLLSSTKLSRQFGAPSHFWARSPD